MRPLIGYVLLVVGTILIGYVGYAHTKFYTTTRPFSSYTVLSSSWDAYKKQFINKDGRVLDTPKTQITTSEGQSYALLRSAWIDDKQTYDQVWKFTKQNMKHKNDNLIGWKWGKLSNGRYGYLPDGGVNSASDADQDIALSLIFAGRRWHNDGYLSDAKNMLSDIWKYEVATGSANQKYLIAGNWANQPGELVVNPSYFAPYAWRVFASVDTKNDWNSLIDPAYKLLSDAGKAPLDKEKGVGLPPDWVSINKKTGQLKKPQIGGLNTDYSYDAMRVPWRIALDYQWNGDPQAKDYLHTSFGELVNQYKTIKKLSGTYAHDGTVIQQTENPTMYATFLGALMVDDPLAAKEMYQEKILKLYTTDQNAFDEKLPYYEQNWLWFSVGLYNKYLTTY